MVSLGGGCGGAPIKTVNEALDSALESEDFDTAGGLVLGLLGHPQKVGDEVRFDSHFLRVEGVDGTRIAQLNVRSNPSGRGSAAWKGMDVGSSCAPKMHLQPGARPCSKRSKPS